MALSFFTPEDLPLHQEITQHLEEIDDSAGLCLFPHLGPQQVSALKYRASDVMRSIRRRSIDAARRRDIKTEMLKSKDLEIYFTLHPTEKSLLESIESQHPKQKFQGIDVLPSYIAFPETTASVGEMKKRRKTVSKIDPLTVKRSSRRRQSKTGV